MPSSLRERSHSFLSHNAAFRVGLVSCGQACSASPTTQQPNKKTDQHLKSIFILAGQSNMAGRGGVVNDTTTGIATWDGVVPPECSPNPSVFRLNVNLTWVKASEPLHADIDVEKTNGIGPGMAFANAVLANHSSTVGRIGLVPCAIGGTNITQWRRGSFLYNQMIRRAKASLQNGGSIRALLWYQGESDTASREDALSSNNRLETFFGDVRLDLQSPDLPIIQVALASGYEATLIEIVREAQLGVDLLNVRTVDAKGLPLEPDGLHLTTPAQVDLGKMLADTYLQFLPIAIRYVDAKRTAHMIRARPWFMRFEMVEIRGPQQEDVVTVDLDATAAVAHTLESAKDAISGSDKDKITK